MTPSCSQVLDLIYEAIIATDLAVYFQVRPKLEAAMSGQFNMHEAEHRSGAHRRRSFWVIFLICLWCTYLSMYRNMLLRVKLINVLSLVNFY